MSDYIPTTDFIRRHYSKGPTAYFENGRIAKMPTDEDVEYAGRQFDRWLAWHDAELLRKHADFIRERSDAGEWAYAASAAIYLYEEADAITEGGK